MMFFSTAFVVLIVLLISQTVKIFRSERQTYEVEQIFFLIAAFLLILAFGDRTYSLRFPAVTNTYEITLFFTAAICVLQYPLSRRLSAIPRDDDWKARYTGYRLMLFIGTIAVSLVAASAIRPAALGSIRQPAPDLLSYWYAAYIILSYIGGAFFVAGFAASVVLLSSRSEEMRREADWITFRSALVGFISLIIGLFCGMIWYRQAGAGFSGRTSYIFPAAAAGLLYLLYICLHIFRGRNKMGTAILSLAGFLAAMYALFEIPGFAG